MRAPGWQVRRLAAGDAGLFGDLNALFGQAFDDAETYGAAPPGAAYLDHLLATDRIVALVALQAGTVRAGLVAYWLDKFEQQRRELYIYDLAVDAAWRRRGIATALIAELRRIGAECDACGIFVQADRGDEAAVALYQKLGVRAEVLHFDIPVRP